MKVKKIVVVFFLGGGVLFLFYVCDVSQKFLNAKCFLWKYFSLTKVIFFYGLKSSGTVGFSNLWIYENRVDIDFSPGRFVKYDFVCKIVSIE